MRFLALLLFSIGWSATDSSAEDWWKSFGKIEPGSFAGGYSDDSKHVLTQAQKDFLKVKKFDEWETYEDEFVKIQYPKHPALSFSKNEGKGGIEVEGGVCTTVDNSFSRAYTLRVGTVTYGVFLLNPATWLDDGI